MSVGLGTAVGYLKLDITGFANGIDGAISDMKRLNGNFSTTSQGLKTIGGNFSKAGSALTAGFTAPVVGFGAASVKAGMDFDSSISQVSAVSKATGEDLKTIRDRAIEMGEKTRYSATEVSDAMYYMGLAGWDATQIYEGIPGVLALGAASGEDLSRVSDIVTDSLTAFGKSADDTSEFVNVLAEASRSSNTTVDSLGESFKYVAPIAGAFGYSLQDTAVALGIFANNGIKGSQAGTGLRQALNALINPSDKAAAQMDKYGVSLFNSDGTTKSLMTVMEELRGTFGGLAIDIHDADGEVMSGEEIMQKYGHSLPTSDMEKLTAITQIFGVRALPGMLSVINATDESFYELKDSIYGAQDAYDGLGTAFGMQETMMDNLQGDWFKFTSALGTTKILLSDMANGALRELVQKLTELVNKFNEMDPAQREQIVKWGLIVAAIGPVLIVIGKIISIIGSLITIFNSLKTAFSLVGGGIKLLTGALGGISAPVLAVIAVVGALVIALVKLWKNNEDFRNKVIDIWNGIKTSITTIVNGIKTVVATVWKGIKTTITTIANGIKTVITTVWNGIKTSITIVLKGIKTTVTSIWNDIKTVTTTVLKSIKTVVSNIWNGIKTVIFTVVKGIKTVISTAFNAIKSTIKTILNAIKTIVTTIWGGIKIAIVTPLKAISKAVSNAFNGMKNTISKVSSVIKNILDGIVNIFTNVGSTFIDIGKNIIQGIIDGITSMTTSLFNTATNILSGFVDDVKNFFQIASPSKVMKNEIGKWLPPGIAEGFVDAMPDAIGDMEDSLNEGIDNIEANDIDAGNVDLDTQITDFIDAYKQMFEGLVIWFETMEERMAIAIEGLTEQFRYLMQVRHVLGDDEFRAFVLGGSGNNNKTKRLTELDTPNDRIAGGGDIFIFQSPKPINEVQAAKMLKDTKRDLAEGF